LLTRLSIDFFLKRYREIYTQLSSGSPTSGFSDWIHRSRKSEILYLSRKKDRAAGTCEWILKNEKFIQWQRAKDRPLLWISGSPGAGKSTLCSAIVDSLETNRRAGEIIACHYVDGRFKNSKLAFEVLGALAIKALSNGISGESSDQLTTLLNDLDATGEQLSSSQISEFLLRIRHSLSAEETLCLVLDGLDDVEGSQSTIDLVREILYLGIRCNRNGWQPVKILVSSRLNWLSTKDLQSALHVDIDRETSVRNDMAGYVRQSIRESRLSTASLEDNPAEEHSWKRWEALLAAARLVFDLTACDYNRVGSLQATAGNQVDALSRRITYHITEHTEGTFLWARLLVENFLIKANHSYNLFEELLDSSKTKDCSAIYEYMIGHISEEDRLVALQMIRWVVGSARPLYSYELLDAVSSQLSIKLVERDIQKYCGILLSKSKSGTVSLTHLSLRDYLQSRTIEDDILGWAAVSDSTNEMIAQICLQVLSSELLLQSWSSSTLQDSASGPTRHASQTIQSYAYHYWEFHYRHAEGESRHLPGLLHEKLKQGQKCRDAICVTTSIPAPAISGEVS
jgi:hypothetical protein